MPRYLISFSEGDMDHLTEEDLNVASVESHAAVEAAKQAGVWIFGGGLTSQGARVVAIDGTVADGPEPGTTGRVGGFAIVEVDAADDALEWAARLAAACRCTQDVREIMYNPES